MSRCFRKLRIFKSSTTYALAIQESAHLLTPSHKTEVQDGLSAKILQMLQMCSLSSWSILNIFDYLLYQILTFKLIHELSHIT